MKTIRFIIFLLFSILTPFAYGGVIFDVDGIYYNTLDVGAQVEVYKKTGGYNIEDIVIPSVVKNGSKTYTVTTISAYAFSKCQAIISITLPNTITKIGVGAFEGCSNLQNIVMSDKIDKILANTFRDCSSLTSVNLPDGVTTIDSNAFQGCSSLTSMDIPNSVSNISSQAFYGCSRLVQISLSNTITSIKEQTFEKCSSLLSIIIPNSVTSIGKYAFRDCTSLQNVSIPNSVSTISEYAFRDCSSLTTVTIPNSITSIENWLFLNCTSLKSVSIPNTVTSIGSSSFSGCSSLTSVTIPNSVTNIGDYAFRDCENLKTIFLREGLKQIGSKAFFGCKRVESVIVPQSVEIIDYSAFGNMTSLKSISVPFIGRLLNNSSTNETTLMGYILKSSSGEGFEEIVQRYPYTSSSTAIEKYYIPTALTEITITGGIVHKYALSGFKNLKTIKITDEVTAINENAFFDCNAVEELQMAYKYNNSIRSLFGNDALSLRKITISSGEIPLAAFQSCRNLIEVKLPENITSIGDLTFSGCTSLPKIELPQTVKSIGFRAFADCTSLKELVLPISIESIHEMAFSSISSEGSLESLYYCGDKEAWDALVSKPSFVNTNIYYNYGSVKPNDVYYKNGICYVVVDEHECIIKEVESHTNSISIPATVQLNGVDHTIVAIGNHAFMGTDNMESLCYGGTPLQWKKILIGQGNEILESIPITYNNDLPKEDAVMPSNYVYLDEMNFKIGSNNIVFGLKNNQAVCGFQFEIELPEGFSLNTDRIKLLTGRTTSQKHNICQISKLNTNRYLLICSSTNNSTFEDNDGPIISVGLNVNRSLSGGDYVISLYNIAIALPSANVERKPMMQYAVSVSSEIPDYIVGDANGDGRISIADVSAIADYLLGKPDADFDENAADANMDGRISIIDVSTIIDMLSSK